MFTQSTPFLSLGSDLQSQSLSSQPPPTPVGEEKKSLGLVNAGGQRSSVWESLRFALCTPVAVLSSVSLKLPPSHPLSPPVTGLPSVWKLFLLHSSLTGAGPIPILLSLFFLFSFALPRYVGSFLSFGKPEVFCQRSVGVL